MPKSSLTFTKMHALGNDFIILNALDTPIDPHKLPITQLSDRHTGIGFDQLLILMPGKRGDYYCRIFNPDNSEAEQCGNGLRCVARYLHQEKIETRTIFSLETLAGICPVNMIDDNHVRIALGTPKIKEKSMAASSLSMSIIDMGNPHAILKVDHIDSLEANALAGQIASLSCFPNGANVGFMQVLDQSHIALRTIERGAGETLACGSNACAAAAAGITNGWLQSKVKVEFQRGSVEVDWQGEGSPISLTGPAVFVYTGKI